MSDLKWKKCQIIFLAHSCQKWKMSISGKLVYLYTCNCFKNKIYTNIEFIYYKYIHRTSVLDRVYLYIIIYSWPMKRLVLSGSKYNDDDVYVYTGQLSHVILYYIYLLLFFYSLDRRGTRGTCNAIRVSGGPCQTDNNSLKLN